MSPSVARARASPSSLDHAQHPGEFTPPRWKRHSEPALGAGVGERGIAWPWRHGGELRGGYGDDRRGAVHELRLQNPEDLVRDLEPTRCSASTQVIDPPVALRQLEAIPGP